MIFYRNGGACTFLGNLCSRRGSVFPQAFSIAAPIAVLSGVLRWLYETNDVQLHKDLSHPLMNESAVWGGFTFLVGFLVVFRTSIAYSRFWDGMTCTHRMQAEWFDACASLVVFCNYSEVALSKIEDFQELMVNLFSLLHAVAISDIEDSNAKHPNSVRGFSVPLLSDTFIDDQSLLAIKDSCCKPELVFQWIQQLIVTNIRTGILSIPSPLLSRVFNELANGMVEFHEALKVSSIPFPFPYAQTCDFLLVAHGLMSPIIISQWVNDMWWAMGFCFLQLFVMWSLRFIAVELENPFGMDANDLDQHLMQDTMNAHLTLLLSPQAKRTPRLQKDPIETRSKHDRDSNLRSAWLRIADAESRQLNTSASNTMGYEGTMKSVPGNDGAQEPTRSVRHTIMCAARTDQRRTVMTATRSSQNAGGKQHRSVMSSFRGRSLFQRSSAVVPAGSKSEACGINKPQSGMYKAGGEAQDDTGKAGEAQIVNHDLGPLPQDQFSNIGVSLVPAGNHRLVESVNPPPRLGASETLE